MSKPGLCLVAAFFVVLGVSGCGGESRDAAAKIEGDHVASTHTHTILLLRKTPDKSNLLSSETSLIAAEKEVSVSLKKDDDGVYVGSGGGFVGQVTATFSKDTALVVYTGSSFRRQRVTLSEDESLKALTTSMNVEVKATWEDDMRRNNDKKVGGRQHSDWVLQRAVDFLGFLRVPTTTRSPGHPSGRYDVVHWFHGFEQCLRSIDKGDVRYPNLVLGNGIKVLLQKIWGKALS